MRLKVIACNVLFREVSHWAARSPHVVDSRFLSRDLHDEPDDLRATLQAEIDASPDYDAIVLGYGLCSNAGAYVYARKVPLVVPRAHDCVTLFLGSRQHYQQSFDENPGTYYYTNGWIERAGSKVERTSVYGQEAYERIYQDYVKRFGEANASYLMETLHSWWKSYSRAAFIETHLPDAALFEAPAREQARQVADEYGWAFDTLQGDQRLFSRLLSGDWRPGEFLIAPPGTQVVPSYKEDVLKATAEPLPVPPRAPRRL